MLEKERHLLRRWAPLVNEIKRIPHLPIELEFDIEKTLHEAKIVKNWAPYRLVENPTLSPEYVTEHSKNYSGCLLVDYVADNIKGMDTAPFLLHEEPEAQFDEQGRLQYFVTPIGDQMPATISCLREVSPYLNRTRIMKTPRQKGVPWHSHHNGTYSLPFFGLSIFILTLETNKKCIHSVRDYRKPASQPYRQHYPKGSVFLFNSWHEHEFWNHGEDDRVVIISYFNLADKDVLSFLEKQVAKYSGPKISC